jgi:hypothetical protein
MDYAQKTLLSIWKNSPTGQWLAKNGFICYAATKLKKTVYISNLNDQGKEFIKIQENEFGVLISDKLDISTRNLENILIEIRLQFLTNFTAIILKENDTPAKITIKDIIKPLPLEFTKFQVLKKVVKKIKGAHIFYPDPSDLLKIPIVKKCLNAFGVDFLNSLIRYNASGVIDISIPGGRATRIDIIKDKIGSFEEFKELLNEKVSWCLNSFFYLELKVEYYDITPMLPLKTQKFLDTIKLKFFLVNKTLIRVELPRLKEVNSNTLKSLKRILPFYSLYQSALPPKNIKTF